MNVIGEGEDYPQKEYREKEVVKQKRKGVLSSTKKTKYRSFLSSFSDPRYGLVRKQSNKKKGSDNKYSLNFRLW